MLAMRSKSLVQMQHGKPPSSAAAAISKSGIDGARCWPCSPPVPAGPELLGPQSWVSCTHWHCRDRWGREHRTGVCLATSGVAGLQPGDRCDLTRPRSVRDPHTARRQEWRQGAPVRTCRPATGVTARPPHDLDVGQIGEPVGEGTAVVNRHHVLELAASDARRRRMYSPGTARVGRHEHRHRQHRLRHVTDQYPSAIPTTSSYQFISPQRQEEPVQAYANGNDTVMEYPIVRCSVLTEHRTLGIMTL